MGLETPGDGWGWISCDVVTYEIPDFFGGRDQLPMIHSYEKCYL
jgi:hypothetical protein